MGMGDERERSHDFCQSVRSPSASLTHCLPPPSSIASLMHSRLGAGPEIEYNGGYLRLRHVCIRSCACVAAIVLHGAYAYA